MLAVTAVCIITNLWANIRAAQYRGINFSPANQIANLLEGGVGENQGEYDQWFWCVL